MRRTPPGVRGLKHPGTGVYRSSYKSHPARGAWIETPMKDSSPPKTYGRTPPGVRGLKHEDGLPALFADCRTPPGVRGLKQACLCFKHLPIKVAPRSECVH